MLIIPPIYRVCNLKLKLKINHIIQFLYYLKEFKTIKTVFNDTIFFFI